MVRFSLYSGKDQKENADDVLAIVMDRLGYKQNYVPEFTRLFFGYLGVAIAGIVYWLEKTRDFRDSKLLVALCCAIYMLTQGAYYLWYWFVERSATYIGTQNGETVYIRTQNRKNTPEYTITVEVSGKQPKTQTLQFNELVDYNGIVHKDVLQSALKPLLSAKVE